MSSVPTSAQDEKNVSIAKFRGKFMVRGFDQSTELIATVLVKKSAAAP